MSDANVSRSSTTAAAPHMPDPQRMAQRGICQSRWFWVHPRTQEAVSASREPEPLSAEVRTREAAGFVLVRDIGIAMEVHPHDIRRWRSVHSDQAGQVRAWINAAVNRKDL